MFLKKGKFINFFEFIIIANIMRLYEKKKIHKILRILEKRKFTGKYRDVTLLLLAVCKHHLGDVENSIEIYIEMHEKAQRREIIGKHTSSHIEAYIRDIYEINYDDIDYDIERVDIIVKFLFPLPKR